MSLSSLDWGEAIDVSVFYGRTAELATLEHWIGQDGCRLVTLMGMGGVGKSALSVKLAEQLQDQFAMVVWRSLRNAPPLADLLADLLMVLSGQRESDLPEAIEGRITRLITHLQQSRSLLVLDNVESVLGTGGRVGAYREGYDAYGQLFRRVGESRHQGCLILTSREMPGGLATKTGHTSPIRSLRLGGLDLDNAQMILQDKGLSPTNTRALIDWYTSNPLALKIASTPIQETFGGDQYLRQIRRS